MRKFTSIIIGNATSENGIHFRKTSFLTESNHEHIENCVRTFISLNFSLAFKNLVKMTCCPKKDIPDELWEDIQLSPEVVPDHAWNTFVKELRYQYKITNPMFMTEFTVPPECSGAYDALATHTSEVAAYMFYKKASSFLYDHIQSTIGQDHISDTFNRLNWHSRDPEANKIQQIKGLRRLSLRDYEAIYFYEHLEKCITLLQSMLDSVKMGSSSSAMEPYEKAMAKDDDLPFFFGTPDAKASTATPEKSFLELSLENVLAYEKAFLGFVLNNDVTCQKQLDAAGFDMEQVRSKSAAIHWVINSHNEMAKAIEALTK